MQRKPQREIFERSKIFELLDSEFVAHVGFTDLDNGNVVGTKFDFGTGGKKGLLS